MQNQPGSDLVLAACVRFWPNGSGPEAGQCARIIWPTSSQCFPVDLAQMLMDTTTFWWQVCSRSHTASQNSGYISSASKTTVSPSKKRRLSSEQPWGNALRGTTSTSLTCGSMLWSWDYAWATTDSIPTCSEKLSWHHHQPAGEVLKTRQLNIYCRDAHFCRQQEQMCGQWQSSYMPNSMVTQFFGGVPNVFHDPMLKASLLMDVICIVS